jgi:flagellum-specific ATP synthase
MSRAAIAQRARRLAKLSVLGRVTGVTGPVVRAKNVQAVVGQQVDLWPGEGRAAIPAEVIGLEEETVLLMALGQLEGVGPGCEVSVRGGDPHVAVGDELLGRIVDGMGQPLDGLPPPACTQRRSLRGKPPSPMTRSRIVSPFVSGVRSVDSMVTIGQGQRMGIFAGAGVGKSTLLSMMARHTEADACVLALVGERGREVREFVEDAITAANRQRTAVVAVTGDASPLVRLRGALLATTIAEHLRDQGRSVLLLFDSLTRFAMALREVGLAAGELPASKGYPPSVFVELSRLLERAGNAAHGGITGIYTVLVEGDDLSDPVADASRALLDGHIVLSRDLANRGVFPAIDVLASKSRLMNQVVEPAHLEAARRVIAMLAAYREAEDLIRIGAYQPGSDPNVDIARKLLPAYEQLLRQELEAGSSFASSVTATLTLAAAIKKGGRP